MIIIYLFAFVFILFFLITTFLVIRDYKSDVKENKNFKFRKYLVSSKGKNYLQSLGMIWTLVFGIVAIIFSAIYSGLTYEQIKISRNSFLTQIEPVVNIKYIWESSGNFVAGMIIKNDGLNDIMNLKIEKDYMNFRQNDTNNSVEFVGYISVFEPNIFKELEINDSIILIFSEDETDYWKSLVYNRHTNSLIDCSRIIDKNERGGIVLKVTYNRLPDLKQYNFIKYLSLDIADYSDSAHGTSGTENDTSVHLTPEYDKEFMKIIDSLYRPYNY